MSAAAASRPRIDSIDFLRGLVIIIMALDHVRDFTTAARIDPLDPAQTNLALYLTRWITNFCAPVFVFLAGASAGFQRHAGKSSGELSKFLLTRGLWLIFLELTVIFAGWTFLPPLGVAFLQVIWAIGVSMAILSALVRLPVAAVAAFGAALVAGHNLFDGLGPQPFTQAANAGEAFAMLLHSPGFIGEPFHGPFVAYPIIPWVGVMALGFAFADIYRWPEAERRKWLLIGGGAVIAAFLILRGINLYGDAAKWTTFDTPMKTAMSFFNTTKYPPSLLFLLMTLGPALIALALAEKWRGRLFDAIVVFGRVPLFFYVLHIYLAHLIGVGLGLAQGVKFEQLLILIFNPPQGFGVGLPGVYAFWALVVVALYPACRWFAGVKKRSKSWWMSYF
ncbi:MAG: DUF1624 domain-containing protein [Pseudomonadota bacterium]